MDLRGFVRWAKQRGDLLQVKQPISPDLELARVVAALDGRPVMFQELPDHPGWRVLSGMCGRREFFAAALDCSVPDLIGRVTEALERPRTPPVIESGPCQAVIASTSLRGLPIPRYHPADGGPYVTAGVAIVADPDTGRNASFHRLMVLDETHFAARIVEGRGTDTALRKVADDLPVAIAIGAPVQVLLAAAMSPPEDVDELSIAHALAPTPMVRCQSVPLEVPAQAELILEGRITDSIADEGPFPDLTGTMDRVRRQPVIEIGCVTHRRAPIFHALLPGGMEHKNLMGMPREPTVFAAVNEVCLCTGVYLTPGGTSWLHAVVQIDKREETDGVRAIHAAFRGHRSLKHVVIVDQDVDPYDLCDVEWAIATRFQGDRDLVVLADEPGSSLDPSGRQVKGERSRTAKMGLDATAPLGEDRRDYERVAYGAVDVSRLHLA